MKKYYLFFLFMYNVVKFGCQERPEISSVEEPTKPLAIQDKKRRIM